MEQSRAFWFSKNGEKLLYATFDATNVNEVTLDKSFKQSLRDQEVHLNRKKDKVSKCRRSQNQFGFEFLDANDRRI